METFLNFIIFMLVAGAVGAILHAAVAFSDYQVKQRSEENEKK